MEQYTSYVVKADDYDYSTEPSGEVYDVYLKLLPVVSGYSVSWVEDPRDATHFKTFESLKSHLTFIIDQAQGGKTSSAFEIRYYQPNTKKLVEELPSYMRAIEVQAFYPTDKGQKILK